MSTISSVIRSVETADTAMSGLKQSMDDFTTACLKSDWDASECARQRAQDYLDAFFNGVAAAWRGVK